MNVHYQSCGDLIYNAHLDKLVEDGSISLRGLKKDAKVFDEMIFDVNTAYFEERGGYEYACQFYEEAFRFAQKEHGPENIVSAVMHADELNTALTEQLGHPVYLPRLIGRRKPSLQSGASKSCILPFTMLIMISNGSAKTYRRS